MKHILRMDSRDNMGNSLGVPIDIQRKKGENFQFLIDKVATRLTSWNHKFLSQPGKLVLINSVLVALSTHTHITQAPRLGGLGIRNIHAFNQALLGKQVFRLRHNPQLLVSKVLSPKYPHIWKPQSTHPRMPKTTSSGHRGLILVDKAMKEGYAWKIGSGNLPTLGTNLVNNLTPTPRDSITLAAAQCSQIHDFITTYPFQWNHNAIFNFFTTQSANQILQLELPTISKPNWVYWKFQTTGYYSVKSGYSFFLSLQNQENATHLPLSKFYKHLWATRIMPKWKVFLWKLSNHGYGLSAKKFLSHNGYKTLLYSFTTLMVMIVVN
ncbi:hypothetical protein RDABS01_009931 [Bienertia sinuspersici]